MPVPVADTNTGDVSTQLKRLAQEVDKIKKAGNKQPKSSLSGIAGHLSNATDLLSAGNKQQNGVSPDQYGGMADAFQAIADELRKGAT